MTTSHNLRRRNIIDWRRLCFGEPLPRTRKEEVADREILDGSFQIERLIAKKHCSKEGDLFLVKWCGYPDTETTWEPKVHIDQNSLYEYIPRGIDYHRLRAAAKTVEDIIQQRLKPGNRCCSASVKFDLDVYRYCFQTDQETLLKSVDDFRRLPLMESWYYRIDSSGKGHMIDFPVRLSPNLRFRKIYVRSKDGKVEQKLVPNETVKFIVPTCAC